MNTNIPHADANGPLLPHRNRVPIDPISSKMLKLVAAYPMRTVQRELNTFIPDSTMLFHVLSKCDATMTPNERFTCTSPAWLPIVSQLYISVLWNFMVLTVQSNSSKPDHSRSTLAEINRLTNVQDCLIPGPLGPFFHALGSTNGPLPGNGNICPILPGFNELWNTGFYANPNFVRRIPIPAVILDQLHYFATWVPPEGQTVHANFQWYRNVFSHGLGSYNRLNRLGPQLVGSLYASATQIDNARAFWGSALSSGITRTIGHNVVFTKYIQLFGFINQTNVIQCDWFSHVSAAMQSYAQCFNGSVPLRSISFTGNGNVAVWAVPRPLTVLRDWLYPADNAIEPFLTSRVAPLRAVPSAMQIVFDHAHYTLPKKAEQYAILTQVNFRLPEGIEAQNKWTVINNDAIHAGDYWKMPPHRTSVPFSISVIYSGIDIAIQKMLSA